MSGAMSDERLAELRAEITERTWVNGNHLLGEMLAEVDRLRYSLNTAVTHRDQAVRTCERRTAERDKALAVRRARRDELCRLRELVRVAQHHIPREWPQWESWAGDAFELLGETLALSGDADYERDDS